MIKSMIFLIIMILMLFTMFYVGVPMAARCSVNERECPTWTNLRYSNFVCYDLWGLYYFTIRREFRPFSLEECHLFFPKNHPGYVALSCERVTTIFPEFMNHPESYWSRDR